MNTGGLIQSLGGPTAVAKALGIGITAVSNWTMGDAIASEHHLAVWRLALAKVKDAPQLRSELELLDAFRSTDEQGRAMLLRLARNLCSEAPVQRAAAE